MLQSSPLSSEDSIAFTDELSSAAESVTATPGCVEELLSKVKLLLSESLVRQVGACYQFDISSGDGQQRRYYVDLSQGDKCHDYGIFTWR